MRAENRADAAVRTLSERLRAVPLLGALVPMTVGIVCGSLADDVILLYVWAVCMAICAVVAWLARRLHAVSTLYITLTILFFGAALTVAHSPKSVVSQGERVWMEVQITDNPTYRPDRRSASASGTAIRWQPASPAPSGSAPAPAGADGTSASPSLAPTGEWFPAGERLLISFDTMYRFEVGERVVFRGYVNPISNATDSYSRLMTARGYTGRTYVSQYSRPATLPANTKAESLGILAKKLQAAATERLYRLDEKNKNPDGIAVAAAMTTGDRSGITPELRKAYSRTGASHLLAVSGLHVGIVFVIINLLLYLLPLFPRGHIARNIVAVAAIWFYAALTGLSPSAMRAAFMFTGAQLALATSRTRNPANIMCGTALVMLAVRPGLLFDISFQLSFIAVGAILAWFSPLYRLVESRFKLLNALWATLLVGFTASVATMPLVSHTFGVFSPAGMVLNPIVIVTAHLVVVSSLVWIIAPIPLLEPLFRWLVGAPAWLQNRTTELTAAVPSAAIEYTMPLWMVFTVYAAMITLTVCLAARPREPEPLILPK